MTSTNHYRTCNLCEAMCGLEIKTENGVITTIAGYKNDPFSRGHICPKAVALKDIYEDPNRLKTPVKRTENGWQPISWDEAYSEIISKLKDIQARHGANAVGVYQGNPSIHNLGTTLNNSAFFKLLKTKNMFSATSTDQLPHHFASWTMLGHAFLFPVPDLDHTDYWLIIGGNPIASNGSMMTAPDVGHRLEAIKKRGKVVVIDPRFTETAEKASEHHFIRPGSDALLLLGMIQVIFNENLVKMGKLADFTEGVSDLKNTASDFDLEEIALNTGISVDNIQRLAREFAGSKTAVCYGRVGVSTQAFGGVCQWLIYALNIITGNFDKEGGAMFTAPAFDIVQPRKRPELFNRWQSRVRKLPEFMGELPVAAMAEEMLTEGDGQIKAMITSCGNPVLSTPNGNQLDKAFESLEFMVAIDIFINETTRHANIILPPATGLETSHYDVTFHVLAIRNTAKYSEPLFPKSDGAKYDWEIYQELAHLYANAVPSNRDDPESVKRVDFTPEAPEIKLNMGLKYGKYRLSLDKLKENPHGIDLGALQPCLPERLFTEDKKIQLAPALLVQDLDRLKAAFNNEPTPQYPFLLIGRRHLRDNNSWMHNSARLIKGRNRCTLMIHPKDAQALSIENQQVVKVTSRVGTVELPAELTDAMMQGVVSMPHGYGHGRKGVKLDIAQKHAGVSVNDLTDEFVIDELTGNSAFSNVVVNVAAVV